MEKLGEFRNGALWKAFLRDVSGVTAIEYGLIMGLIAVAVIFVLTSMGTGLANIFNTIGNTLTNT